MTNSDMRRFIESIQDIPYTPANLIASKAVTRISRYFDKAAAVVEVHLPEGIAYIETSGEKSQTNLIKSFLSKHQDSSVSEAQFTIKDGDRYLLTVADSNFPSGYSSKVAVLTKYDFIAKDFCAGVVGLYSSNISLGLAFSQLDHKPGIEMLFKKQLKDLAILGVENLTIVNRAIPDRSFFVDKSGIKHILNSASFNSILAESSRYDTQAFRDKLKTLLTKTAVFEDVKVIDAGFSGSKYSLIISGRFQNAELIKSKVQDILSDPSLISDYNDLLRAYGDLKSNQENLVKSERVAAILETAVTINHEINNPLMAIIGNTQLLLLKEEELEDKLVSKIKTIEKSAMRIRDVTKKLMSIVEPITTSYTDGLSMLDIEKISESDKKNDNNKAE